VSGNTVLDTESIERAVMPFLGPQRTMADVEGARGALERAYQQRGFLSVAVDVPEQQVDDAVVVLQVVEATVERLRVRGSRYYSLGTIRAALPAAAEGTVPQFADVERQLSALGATPGLTVTPALKPGRTPGTLDIDLNVEDRPPLAWTIDVNNQRAVNTTPWRLGLGLRHSNLWGRRHTLGLGVLFTPSDPSQVNVLTASYAWPLGGPTDPTLSFYAVRSDSETPTVIGGTTVFGGQAVLGLRLVTPLSPRFGLFHTWSLGLDAKRLVQQDFPTLEYLPFSVGYSAVRPGRDATTQLEATLNASIRGMGNDDEAFSARRFLGSASYAYLRWDAAHEQSVSTGLSLRGRLAGQYAMQPLVPAEQFALGGAGTVRGYLESSAFGDRGLLASIELRTRSAPLPGLAAFTAQWLGFYDHGVATIVEPLPEQRVSYTLASGGVGVRVRWGRTASATLDLARALRDLPTQDDSWRVHVRLQLEL